MNEIEILKKNVRDLQEQLRTAYVRIKQLKEELSYKKMAGFKFNYQLEEMMQNFTSYHMFL